MPNEMIINWLFGSFHAFRCRSPDHTSTMPTINRHLEWAGPEAETEPNKKIFSQCYWNWIAETEHSSIHFVFGVFLFAYFAYGRISHIQINEKAAVFSSFTYRFTVSELLVVQLKVPHKKNEPETMNLKNITPIPHIYIWQCQLMSAELNFLWNRRISAEYVGHLLQNSLHFSQKINTIQDPTFSKVFNPERSRSIIFIGTCRLSSI